MASTVKNTAAIPITGTGNMFHLGAWNGNTGNDWQGAKQLAAGLSIGDTDDTYILADRGTERIYTYENGAWDNGVPSPSSDGVPNPSGEGNISCVTRNLSTIAKDGRWIVCSDNPDMVYVSDDDGATWTAHAVPSGANPSGDERTLSAAGRPV